MALASHASLFTTDPTPGYRLVPSYEVGSSDPFATEPFQIPLSRPSHVRDPSRRALTGCSWVDVAILRYRKITGGIAWSKVCQDALGSTAFQTLCALVILANAVCMGFETDLPDAADWQAFEYGFLLFFSCELCLRITAVGPSTYFVASGDSEFMLNTLDVVLITLGIADSVVTAIYPSLAQKRSYITLFRIVRLLRIVRIFRFLRVMKQLYLLAYGFAEGVLAVFWVAALTAFLLCICSIVLTRTFGRPADDDPDREFYMSQFGSTPQTMLTLFELISNPDLKPFHEAIFKSPALIIFLITVVVFGSFGLIALLTGVLCESIFEKNQFRVEEERMERESKRSQLATRCGQLFERIDEDRSGSLTRGEVMARKEDIKALFADADVAFAAADMDTMFEVMDSDGSGTVEKQEFVQGVLQLCEDIKPLSIVELHYAMSKCTAKVERCDRRVEASMQAVAQGLRQAKLDFPEVTSLVGSEPVSPGPRISQRRLAVGTERVGNVGDTVECLHQEPSSSGGLQLPVYDPTIFDALLPEQNRQCQSKSLRCSAVSARELRSGRSAGSEEGVLVASVASVSRPRPGLADAGSGDSATELAARICDLVAGHFHVLVQAQRRAEASRAALTFVGASAGSGAANAAAACELASVADALAAVQRTDARQLQDLARGLRESSGALSASSNAPPWQGKSLPVPPPACIASMI